MTVQKVRQLNFDQYRGRCLIETDTGGLYFVSAEKQDGTRHIFFEHEGKPVRRTIRAYAGDVREGTELQMITAKGEFISFKLRGMAKIG